MARYSGKGWHRESLRHSQARKYGKATPKKIDLKKYMGTWKQISVKPTPFFQKGCKKVKAKYRLLPNGKVEVINTCDGKKITGTARSVSPDNKKLKVSFFPPFEGDYNIVKLNPSYTRATIKGGKYTWELQKVQKKNYYKPKPIAPLKQESTELPIQFSINVPSTTEKSKPISGQEFQKRIEETKKFLSENFGGDTEVKGKGDYTSKGELIQEDVSIVESSMKPEAYNENKAKLEQFITNKKKEWGQESILYNFEDSAYIYPAFS